MGNYNIQLPQIDSPVEVAGRAMQLRQMINAGQMFEMQRQQHTQALADDASYRSAIQANPQGGESLLRDLASAGNYKGYAAAQKADLDARKGVADIDQSKATALKAQTEALNQAFTTHRDLLNTVNDPTTAAQWVASAYQDPVLGPLVSRMGPVEAAVSRIPKDPAGFAQWKQQASLNAEKYVHMTTVDANTAATNTTSTDNNKRTVAATERGQDLQDKRAAQFNDITAEANNSQVIETPQGFQVVNKGTANARPVGGPNGQPLLGKDSTTAKNAQMANRLTGMIPLAKQLLQSGATASGAGALADRALAFTGVSTKGGDAATALETLSGWMTSNVPRFEGPQSDKDTATYRIMAGLVGDRTAPMGTRVKALDTMQQIMQQYMGHSAVEGFSGPPGTQPATPVAPRPVTPQGYPHGGPGVAAPGPGGATPPAGARPPIESFFQ